MPDLSSAADGIKLDNHGSPHDTAAAVGCLDWLILVPWAVGSVLGRLIVIRLWVRLGWRSAMAGGCVR